MKKIFIIFTFCFLTIPAFSTCTVTGGTVEQCTPNTAVCSGSTCTISYTYVPANPGLCRCTSYCTVETPPPGYTIDQCICLNDDGQYPIY